MIHRFFMLILVSLTLASPNVLLEEDSDLIAEETEMLTQTDLYQANSQLDLELLSSPLQSNLDEMWEQFKILHQKSFSSAKMEMTRRKIWETNLQKIQEHNEMKGLHGYDLGVNQFSDWTIEEFKNHLTPFNLTDSFGLGATYIPPSNVGKLPRYCNWTQRGAVTPVKNQYTCGSCYAFSALGALEAQQYRKTKQLVALSEQNIVDCLQYGCNGGYMTGVYEYILKNGGVDTEASYPYRNVKQSCKFNRRHVGATLSGYFNLPMNNEKVLQSAVAFIGPVAAGINAKTFGFKEYKSGIYNNRKCDNKLDHAVLIVGYGTENGQAYWLVKNSWGPYWGIHGYAKMARNRDNQCGIATLASVPFV